MAICCWYPGADTSLKIDQVSLSSVSTCASESLLDLFEVNYDELKEHHKDRHGSASLDPCLPATRAGHGERTDPESPPDPDLDDYDVANAIADFANQRPGDAVQRRCEDLANASTCLLQQALCLKRASQRVDCAPEVRAHYSRVRLELLQELEEMTSSYDLLGAQIVDAIPQVSTTHLQPSSGIQEKRLETRVQIACQANLRSVDVEKRAMKRLSETQPVSDHRDAKRSSMSDVDRKPMLPARADNDLIPGETRIHSVEHGTHLAARMCSSGVCSAEPTNESTQTYSGEIDVYATYFCE